MAIEIVPYNPEWPRMYEQEREKLVKIKEFDIKYIEHVGSTSVPEQVAKPVVDIFMGVDPFRGAEHYKGLLPEGYQYTITDMEDRHLFAKYENGVWSFNLHIMSAEGFYDRKEFFFRDWLRSHKDAREEYTACKLKFAEAMNEKNVSDEQERIVKYTREKTRVIQKIIDEARAERGLPSEPVWEGEHSPLDDTE